MFTESRDMPILHFTLKYMMYILLLLSRIYINSLHVIHLMHGHIMIMLTFLACQGFLALYLQ